MSFSELASHDLGKLELSKGVVDYSAPYGEVLDFTFVGAPAYTPPAWDAVAFNEPAAAFELTVAAVLAVTASLALEHLVVTIDATLTATVPVVAGLDASHGVTGSISAVIAVSVDQTADHGVTMVGIASIPLQAAASIVVDRYELRGEIRLAGVLVNRRVRAYLRSSGALLGEADTVVGRFQVHTGFAAAECYVTPIDMSTDATDWLPPTANRISSVLAMDTA